MNRPSRAAARCAALVVLAGVAVVAAAVPASASSYSTLSAANWAYTDSHDPKKAFVKLANDAPLGTRVDAAQQKHTSRFYFSFDLTALRGKVIHWAPLSIREASVADCASAGTVELWRTGPITSKTTWSNPPAERERLGTVRPNRTYECPAWLSFDIIDALNAALGRRESSVTFELRLAAEDEQNTAYFSTLKYQPAAAISANTPPTVSGLTSTTFQTTRCGSFAKPSTAYRFVSLNAAVSDADNYGYVNGEFALWPAGDPAQRKVIGAGSYGSTIRLEPDLSEYPDQTLIAFAVRSYDQEDYSAWSKPCYLRIDKAVPTDAPKVSSRTFVESRDVASGGEGLPGEFTFDAQGDHDVVSFRYSFNDLGYSQIVPAKRAGGRATISYTPRYAGPKTLTVQSMDAAGNAGPEVAYQFFVAWTAPGVSVDVGGVGLPSHITMSSYLAGLSGFSYQIDSGPEVKFPAVNGTGTAELTFTQTGTANVTARTYVNGKVAGLTIYEVLVSDEPAIASEQFSWDHESVLGDQGSFTFTPRTTNVVAYRYSFNYGDWQEIAARPDGTGLLTWTADISGWINLDVVSVQAGGTTSVQASTQFDVIDPHPVIWTDENQSWPRRDGVGLPTTVEFSSFMANVTGFVYRFNGGPEQSIEGAPYATTFVTPDHAGENTIVAQAVYADGTRSPATTHTFTVTSGPIVSWNGDAMMLGDTATFTVRPALSGVTSYRYAFESNWPGDATQTVTAQADGTATLSYMLTSPGYHVMEIASVGADGTVSDYRIYDFIVSDPTVGVYGYYLDFMTRGGIGVPGYMSFYSGMASQVVKFVYQVNGGPEQSVAMPPESTSASTTITPDRNGTNVLTVKSLMTDGRYSPTTTYQFLVGTAPYVQSLQYPDNTWSGGAGVPGDFTFSGGTADIVAFTYQFSDGTPAQAAADATGSATIQWTPAAPGFYSLTVQGKLADGTLTDATAYTVYVQYS